MDPSNNGSNGGSGNEHNNKNDGSDRLASLMMAAIPRRSLPPVRQPSETAASAGPAAARAADALENMTIPRRSLSSKPSKERSGSLTSSLTGGGSSHHARTSFDQHKRPSSSSSHGGGSLSHHHQQQQQQQQQQPKQHQQHQPKKIRHVSIQSEYPFVVKIRLRGVAMDNGGLPRPPASMAPVVVDEGAAIKRKLVKKEKKAIKKEAQQSKMPMEDARGAYRTSSRAPKRERPSYEEVNESDGLVDSSEGEDENYAARPKKLRRGTDSNQKATSSGKAPGSHSNSLLFAPVAGSTAPALLDPGSGGVVVVGAPTADGTLINAPPPGMLSPMWYSRECFLHIFVVEKIVGWKRRPVTSLEWADANALKFLDPKEASTLSQKALTHKEVWIDPRKRMELSRINVTQCPVVLSIAAEREKAKASDEGRTPEYAIKAAAAAMPDQHEDVLLVKWRGRSFLHCSWERSGDIIKLDPSNSTARHKIRRYFQSQEVALGKDWQKLVEEERATAAAIHSHGEVVGGEEQASETEEFFANQCLEIERILGCDENEMDTNVLAKQRALNSRTEQEVVRRKEEAEAHSGSGEGPKPKTNPLFVKDLVDVHKIEEPWDPEDNVRYVVKWKGLPFAEMTWEYWRDIKHDAVDEAEDFWHIQKPPSPEVLQNLSNREHPHVRDFRKLQATATYGISSRVRPVASLVGDGIVASEEDESDTKQGFQLRSYQLEGVNWLLFNWWNKRSCILADEMGLGKTVQTLGFIQELCNNPLTKIRGPFLIVAPLSLIGQWQSEARSWVPDYNVVLYHGSADAREFLAQQEFYYSEQFMSKATAAKLRKQHVTKFRILITTYEVVLKDIAVLSKIKWKALIVDEAHRLKNASSRLFAELASVPRDYCVLLTGTPLANNTEELWALLHFCDPTFADREDFLEKFGQLSDSTQVNELHTILKPYLLRRVKEDVEKSLPPKEETILEVTLTPIQKKYYKAIYERNTAFLYKGAKPSNSPSLMNVMMELRKICNHSFLVKGVEDRILADAAANWKAKDENGNDKPVDYVKVFTEQLVKSSGKMVLLEKLLSKLFTGGHKVLIFSQMVRVLDLLEELLKIKKYKYERLDGSTSSSSRASAVDRFGRKSCQRFVMLLSTRAGGLGLNLTSADIVIIFDSDWNPQNDLQAMARAHRIGQTRKVQIFRLLTAKTYEMHMFHSASMKLGLERAVLSQQRDQSDVADDSQKKPQSEKQAHANEIDQLLKKGAYDVFKDDDDTEAEKFMEADIDQLLERSSKKVTYGASSTSSLGSGLGSFSKASFVTDTGEGEKDVDLDDPDFWAKAVGIEAPVETPEEIAQMLDDGVKRSRKQVTQYNPYAEFEEQERIKEEKIALKEREAKEETERLRAEKRKLKEKKKKKKEKQKEKKRDREEMRSQLFDKSKAKPAAPGPVKKEEAKKKVASKEGKPTKKHKKNDRKRALRRAANEDPIIERLKQAWEAPQRNRATAAALRFGFGRFNKIRHESNLTSVPLQDLEVFIRSYTYQIALQVAVTFLAQLQKNGNQNQQDLRGIIREWMGPGSDAEVEWLCSSIYSVMEHHMDVQKYKRFLRMPLILAEPSYVANLRQGGAFRALRRLGICSRLNRIMEEGLDSVLSVLGHEELAKRGCGTSDLSTLDADLRARHVSTEELALATGVHYRKVVDLEAPASWWDRSCDIGLIIGSFVHGLGNFTAMRNDEDLPFLHIISVYAESDEACRSGNVAFQAAAAASRKVFDDALESAKAQAALEIQAAVAAAAAAASEREQDALALRQGGAAADAVISSKPGAADTSAKKTLKFTEDDKRFVTLPRLQKAVLEAIRNTDGKSILQAKEAQPVSAKSNGTKSVEVVPESSVSAVEDSLPMPDSRVLDRRLIELLNGLERSLDLADKDYQILEAGNRWEAKDDVLTNGRVRTEALSLLYKSKHVFCQLLSEYSGVGINGTQCGSSHRSLDDGADYSIGAASLDLSQVAYGTDSPRYLLHLGVPRNLTRFAISALVYAEVSTVQAMLDTERIRYYGEQTQEELSLKNDKCENISTSEEETSAGSNPEDAQKLSTESKPEQVQKLSTDSKPDQPQKLSTQSKPNDLQKQSTENKPDDTESKGGEAPKLSTESNPSVERKPDVGLKTKLGDTHATYTYTGSKPDDTQTTSSEVKSEVADKPPVETKSDAAQKTKSDDMQMASTDCKPDTAQKPLDERKPDVASPDDTQKTSAEVKPKVADKSPVKTKPEAPSPPVPKASADLVPEEFRRSATVRAAICSAVLLYGFPSSIFAAKTVNASLWSSLQEQCGAVGDKGPSALFDMDVFMVKVKDFAENADLPSSENVRSYVEKVLLPFCLRLCVMGNGPSTRAARGSQGEFDTAFGISQYPEPCKNLQSPLPDPCMEREEQSLEAVAYASAILRRVRLMRAALHVASGDVSVEQLEQAARSSFTCKNMDGLPLWWCPWVHDVALLAHAATNGLFSILQDRHKDDSRSVFSRQVIVQTMYSSFVADEKVLPKALVERSSPEDSNEWIDLHAGEFPSVNVLERRLAFLCTVATAPLQGEMRYDNVPMFDHGGWPRL